MIVLTIVKTILTIVNVLINMNEQHIYVFIFFVNVG